MLEFLKNETVLLDGQIIDFNRIDRKEFFMASLYIPVKIGEGVKLETLMNHFFYVKDFVYLYYSEHYERLRALVEAFDSNGKFSELKIFNKMVVENGYVSINPSVDLIKAKDGEFGPKFVGGLNVYQDEKLVVIEENNDKKVVRGDLKMNMTLLDLMSAIFDDLVFYLTEGYV